MPLFENYFDNLMVYCKKVFSPLPEQILSYYLQIHIHD